jgi:AcrR family transcriptional regulator
MGKRVDIQERPYHHGDLRRAIVRAAPEILSEMQSVDFSLRELARRAGVSHNAPYSILPRSLSYWRLSRQLDSN